MDNRKKRLLGMGFVVAVLFAASMLAFQMQKAAPAAAPAQPAGKSCQSLCIITFRRMRAGRGNTRFLSRSLKAI